MNCTCKPKLNFGAFDLKDEKANHYFVIILKRYEPSLKNPIYQMLANKTNGNKLHTAFSVFGWWSEGSPKLGIDLFCVKCKFTFLSADQISDLNLFVENNSPLGLQKYLEKLGWVIE